MSRAYVVQLIKPPTHQGEPSILDREFGYPSRAEADRLAADWGRLQGVRDGSLVVRVVERRS